MEFDVESFMYDVTAALAHGSPHQQEGRREDNEAIPQADSPEEEPLTEYEEFIQYPSDDAARSSRCGSLQSAEFVMASGDNTTFEYPAELQVNPPAVLDLGMCNVITPCASLSMHFWVPLVLL